jgi:chaperonin cofactor prefoldin
MSNPAIEGLAKGYQQLQKGTDFQFIQTILLHNSYYSDRSKMSNALAKLAQQENENELVLNELKLLGDDSAVYKLVGPVLIKQDLDEARSNVEKRLQFIGDEM